MIRRTWSLADLGACGHPRYEGSNIGGRFFCGVCAAADEQRRADEWAWRTVAHALIETYL